jgi:hypothetical protein
MCLDLKVSVASTQFCFPSPYEANQGFVDFVNKTPYTINLKPVRVQRRNFQIFIRKLAFAQRIYPALCSSLNDEWIMTKPKPMTCP